MADTKVKQHQWMKIVYTPLEVLDDGDGNPVVIIDPDKEDAAQANASYGCFACDLPLEGNMKTECTGRDELTN